MAQSPLRRTDARFCVVLRYVYAKNIIFKSAASAVSSMRFVHCRWKPGPSSGRSSLDRRRCELSISSRCRLTGIDREEAVVDEVVRAVGTGGAELHEIATAGIYHLHREQFVTASGGVS